MAMDKFTKKARRASRYAHDSVRGTRPWPSTP